MIIEHSDATVRLESALTLDECLQRLDESIDPKCLSLFSLSGYAGDRPVIGQIDGTSVVLFKRRYWRNDFAPNFYGILIPNGSGTLIEGHWGSSPWVKMFMRIWLIFVAAIGVPIFFLSAKDLLTGSHTVSGDLWVGIFVPPALLLYGWLLPKLGLLFSYGDKDVILSVLEDALAAQNSADNVPL